MPPKQKSPCCVYDFTLPDHHDRLLVAQVLRKVCKKWTFQREVGAKSGFKHYQGRVSTKVKTRVEALGKLLHAEGLTGLRASLTSEANQDNVFYVIKTDHTYVEGPWSDKDFYCEVTRQVAEYRAMQARPWALQIERILKTWTFRQINLVFDRLGCSGKSLLTAHLHQLQVAYAMPPMDSVEDIMNIALATKAKAYMIDMPRGLTGKNLRALYVGLESLKNGVAYDKRYTWRLEHFEAPALVVFTNTMPDLSLLSRDKWVLWTINHQTWELERIPTPSVESQKRKREEEPQPDFMRKMFKKWLFSDRE